jgi:predicted RNase H-like HicB family nuclease
MLSIYPACFFKEESGYSVIFPDLDLATCGENIDEAMAMAVDCLAGRLHWLKQDGEPIPEPSSMNAIDPAAISKELEIEPSEAFVNMVSVDVEAYAKAHFDKSVRKTLTIPSWLNTAASEMGINFSQTLQEALLAKVQAK